MKCKQANLNTPVNKKINPRNKDVPRPAPPCPKAPPLLEPTPRVTLNVVSGFPVLAAATGAGVDEAGQNHEPYEWFDQLANHAMKGLVHIYHHYHFPLFLFFHTFLSLTIHVSATPPAMLPSKR